MKLGYLINAYPMPSQTFIGREVRALEALVAPNGPPLPRYAIRRPDVNLPDPTDRREAEMTHYVLSGGRWRTAARLALALLGVLTTSPLRLGSALRMAIRLGDRNGQRGVIYHLVYLAEACVVQQWSRRDGVEHLHVHFGSNSATVAMLAEVLGGPSFSVTVHGPNDFDDPLGWALGEKTHRATFVATVSNFGRAQMMRWAAHQDWPKIRVIRCGLDASFFDLAPTQPPVVPRLVSIGRLDEQKGQLLLLEAMAQVVRTHPDAELVLIGDGPFRPLIEARIRELQLEDRVRLLGWADGATVKSEILASRALVLPSFAEGLPVVLMESLALHRPVVATYIAGIPSLVKSGRSGWLVPAGSVEHLAEAMSEVLSTPSDALFVMGKLGALDVSQQHDIRRQASLLRDAIASSLPIPVPVEVPTTSIRGMA